MTRPRQSEEIRKAKIKAKNQAYYQKNKEKWFVYKEAQKLKASQKDKDETPDSQSEHE